MSLRGDFPLGPRSNVSALRLLAPSASQGYRARYWNEPYFKALKLIQDVADKNGLTMAEIALRWVSHHSLMKREAGDAVLIGASSLKHIEQVRERETSFWFFAFCKMMLLMI